ncbi:thiol:disulfide interchange protein [Sulfurifustis variabilis]|uniref:Thiol:disulfide interchange protein n=1 Tax=Sulfurifustis variabilis TaxID=1675686 RepID=A0A1B4VH22_9GAMM|nr:protein-disulfide reductase DsbD [Sulfurifustis variabilis]BAU50357.1 thiol:disulfide interchange protein [Sulfurifustis variabilis]
MIKRLPLLLLLVSGLAAAAGEDELLEPDQAFALTTRAVDASTVEASWRIAPGYYLYRDKFKFESLDERMKLGEPVMPSGKRKEDPFFGATEIYTKGVSVRLPVEGAGGMTARLRITAQGCNEPVGVCYPPITKEVDVALPAAARPATATSLSGVRSLKELSRTLDVNSGQPEVVDPEKAFLVDVAPIDSQTLRARFTIADCCYLYRDKTSFEVAGARLGGYELPKGKTKNDEFFGEMQVYYDGFEVRLPVAGLAQGAPAVLKVGYQGCSEKGVAICYPPATKQFQLSAVSGTIAVAPLGAASGGALAATPATSAASDMPGAPGTPVSKYLLAMLAAFGVGLLLTFTPCVLPMIPILSSVIVGSAANRNITKLEGGMLSLAYVLGTAVTYTTAGVIAGATGEQLQAYFQNPWILGTFAALFLVLSLSMFGFYELQMPSFIQSHLHHHSHHVHSRFKHLKGGAFFGLFGMGLLSALIVGACVSPLFISALGVAIANRDPLLGGLIMFAMALGMGVILIGIGVGAGFLLPKAGPWMNKVKQAFGVLLIAVAIYLLGFIPEVPVLFLWAALFIVVAVYLGATQSLPKDATGLQYLWKGVGTLLLVWGVLALIGGMAGNRDILYPLPVALYGQSVAGTGPAPAQPLFRSVRTVDELEAGLVEARSAGKGAVLDYYATWCTDCVRMEKSTFLDARVREAFSTRFVALQADVTDPNDPAVRAMKQRFGVFGPPAMLFFGPDGEERKELRTYGYKNADELLALLGRV